MATAAGGGIAVLSLFLLSWTRTPFVASLGMIGVTLGNSFSQSGFTPNYIEVAGSDAGYFGVVWLTILQLPASCDSAGRLGTSTCFVFCSPKLSFAKLSFFIVALQHNFLGCGIFGGRGDCPTTSLYARWLELAVASMCHTSSGFINFVLQVGLDYVSQGAPRRHC